MDSKSLAKSKRAHTQHHSKKSHSVHKPKGPGLSEKNQEKLPGNQTKSPVQSRRISALMSNWDRYYDEVDESVDFSISQPTDVVVPRSKGAYYLHLISEAQAESQSKIDISSDCLSPVDDLLHDVSDAVLLETFAGRYPSVKGAKVVIDSNTGRSKGYRFVRFSDENERSRAMTEMNGAFCSNRQMRVGIAIPKRAAAYGQQNGSQALTLAGGHGGNGSMANGSLSDGESNNSTIFVGGLDA